MNVQVVSALFKDALYQVLDNKVFRLLAILIVLMVLPTFLIAARSESLVILFGWREFFYEDIFMSFGIAYPGPANANVALIQTVQSLLVDNLAGTFGISFAIAATAFFTPRMIEKGAADTVFSKPVGRLTLMLSRYFAGLLFVSILAALLVGGMHVGLLLNSGYSDPGFLWSILTLIYLFALLHAFSIAVGVFTRSTVAAILLSLMFFAFSGCVHGGWSARQFFVEQIEPHMDVTSEAPDATEEEGTMRAVASGLFVVLDALHYTLPKTSDAGFIAESLRRQVSGAQAAYSDEDSSLKILVEPAGYSKAPPDAERPAQVARWTAPGHTGRREASITLERHRSEDKSRSDAINELEETLETQGIEFDKDRVSLPWTRAHVRSWTEGEGDSTRLLRSHFFSLFHDGTSYLFVLAVDADKDWFEQDEQQRDFKAFVASISRDVENRNPVEYAGRAGKWSGPLKYNFWFSIGSSFAFGLLALGLGWWRLSRIDF